LLLLSPHLVTEEDPMTVEGLRRLLGALALTALPAVAAAHAQGAPSRIQKKSAGVSMKVMSQTELTDYIKKVHARIAGMLSLKSRSNSELILQAIRAEEKSPAAIAFSATGIWIAGHTEEALYVMGVACSEDPTSAEKLNNYAAFITMAGAPDVALPILFQLNSRYPGNSTVLNNIGQAWFALGDAERAEKSLDSAIRVFPYHAQANETKAIIEAAKGNKAAAIAALVNSLQRSYSQSRMSRLEKLGGKLGGKLGALPAWGFHMPQDALGLEKIIPPKYPKDHGEVAGLQGEWKKFKDDVLQRSDELKVKETALDKAIDARSAPAEKLLDQAAKKGDLQAMQKLALKMMQDRPPFYQKAMVKLRSELGEDGGGMVDVRMHQEMLAMHDKAIAESDVMIKEWEQELAPISKANLEQSGEGMPNKTEPFCSQTNALSDKYLGRINGRFEEYGLAVMNARRKEINTLAYYLQYATPGGDDAVALMETREKLEYMGEMYSLPVLLDPRKCSSTAKYQKSGMGPLADFYDLHCTDVSTLSMPGLGSITIACNKMTTSFKAGPISASWTENLETGVVMKGTLEIGLSASSSLGSTSQPIAVSRDPYDAPFSAELGASMTIGTSAFIEIENGSISDFGAVVTASASSNLALGSGALSGEIVGIESKLGWNSGATTTGSGILSGLQLSTNPGR
jgi:Tfp pilus assembly protein PilF